MAIESSSSICRRTPSGVSRSRNKEVYHSIMVMAIIMIRRNIDFFFLVGYVEERPW